MKNLNSMKQYPIERDLFCKLFYIIDLKYYDYLFDTTTDNFKLWYYDTFYILHL